MTDLAHLEASIFGRVVEVCAAEYANGIACTLLVGHEGYHSHEVSLPDGGVESFGWRQ